MPSYRKAIDAHCKSCGYDEKDKGTWRYQIEICGCTHCELYDLRPQTIANRRKNQDKTEKEGYPTSREVLPDKTTKMESQEIAH